MNKTAEIYDTTLRDGTQAEGLSPTVGEKLRVVRLLDELGVHFVEGGWPGANPKDDEFFARATKELELERAQLVAFGSTRRPRGPVERDPQLQALLDANTDFICIVGKSWDRHVTDALNTSLEEGLDMVGESIDFLRERGKRVFFDAEHFFDGFRHNPEYALSVVETAARAGAERVVLCDTNGGALPPISLPRSRLCSGWSRPHWEFISTTTPIVPWPIRSRLYLSGSIKSRAASTVTGSAPAMPICAR